VRPSVSDPLTPSRAFKLAAAAGLLALAMLAALLTAARDARAARGMEVALQDDAVFVSQSYFDRARAFGLARALGVTRLRVNANWAFLMPHDQAYSPTKPATVTYTFNQIDSAIDAAARYGIRVHLSLTGPAPAWATSDHRVGPVRPSAAEFAQFASAAARHFRGRVDRYSIWNEPNWHSWLGPLNSSPALYRALYVAGYRAIKGQDGRAKVLIGETAPYAQRGRAIAPIKFLRAVTCVNGRYRRVRRCSRLRADGYAQHPYDFTHSPRFRFPGRDNATMATLSNLTSALDRLSRAGALRPTRGRRMPVYLTEYGYFASGARHLPWRRAVSYLKQGWDLALRNGRVKSQLQYLLVSPPRGSPFRFFDLGLMSASGSKHPTYNALRSWYRKNRRKVKRPGPRIALPAPPPAF
jgi:hypothetical protein